MAVIGRVPNAHTPENQESRHAAASPCDIDRLELSPGKVSGVKALLPFGP
jgi:hypothetical protein